MKVLLSQNENVRMMCMLGVFHTIVKNVLILTAMFQNDVGKVFKYHKSQTSLC